MLSVGLISPKELLRAFLPLSLLFIFIITGALVNATSSHPYLPKHYRIASSPEVPGKGKLHHCFPYAQELQRQLYFEAGLLSSMIFFNWTDDNGDVGSHVVVHYWDKHGNQWLVDNQTPKPVNVEGETSSELVSQLYPELNIDLVPTLIESF
jgi:hypothetical protein